MIHLKNCMEDAVFAELDTVLSSTGNCHCERCKMDIAAIALNQLKPKYVVSEKGVMFAKANAMNQQFQTDIITAITNAITMVGRSPRHDKE